MRLLDLDPARDDEEDDDPKPVDPLIDDPGPDPV